MEDYGFHLQTEEDLKPRKPVRLSVDPNEQIILLPDLEDDPKGVRRGESGVISLVVHAVVVAILLLWGKIFTSTIDLNKQPARSAQVMLYLNEPAVEPRPEVKAPQLSKKDIDQMRAMTKRPEIPAPPTPPAPQPETPAPPAPTPKALPQAPQAQTPQVAQPQGSPQSTAPPTTTPPPQNAQPGEIHLSEVKPVEPPKMPVAPTIGAGQSLDQTLRGIAKDRASGVGGQTVVVPGVGGISARGPGQIGSAKILTDTQGVDFDPYLRRILFDIQRNWQTVMPEAARMGKKGLVVLEFEIMRDGAINKVYLTGSSQFEPFDRAAFAGLMAAAPFPPLPNEFKGPMVRLRLGFYYNTKME